MQQEERRAIASLGDVRRETARLDEGVCGAGHG
jgi:hypothetical protein